MIILPKWLISFGGLSWTHCHFNYCIEWKTRLWHEQKGKSQFVGELWCRITDNVAKSSSTYCQSSSLIDYTVVYWITETMSYCLEGFFSRISVRALFKRNKTIMITLYPDDSFCSYSRFSKLAKENFTRCLSNHFIRSIMFVQTVCLYFSV